MDKGMKKVVNLVTNYVSALCETGRVPGRVDRNIEAGTAVYFPGGLRGYSKDNMNERTEYERAKKVFGNVIEECLEAFFSACCEDVKYTQSQEYFADFAENNEFKFYENDICIRHR